LLEEHVQGEPECVVDRYARFQQRMIVLDQVA
jgi:hypothetical protein